MTDTNEPQATEQQEVKLDDAVGDIREVVPDDDEGEPDVPPTPITPEERRWIFGLTGLTGQKELHDGAVALITVQHQERVMACAEKQTKNIGNTRESIILLGINTDDVQQIESVLSEAAARADRYTSFLIGLCADAMMVDNPGGLSALRNFDGLITLAEVLQEKCSPEQLAVIEAMFHRVSEIIRERWEFDKENGWRLKKHGEEEDDGYTLAR